MSPQNTGTVEAVIINNEGNAYHKYMVRLSILQINFDCIISGG